jgi:hypothetical protein
MLPTQRGIIKGAMLGLFYQALAAVALVGQLLARK